MTWWIKFGLTVLLLTAVVVWGLGMMLPEQHTASVTVTLAAPQDSVWAAVTDPSAFPSWRPGVTAVEVLPDAQGRPRWRETAGGETLTLEVTQWTPPRELVTRIADEGLPFGGTWVYELDPVDGGTRVTLTENGEVYSPVFRFVAQFFLGHEATLNAYRDALVGRFGALEP